jgi:hypothetical protein
MGNLGQAQTGTLNSTPKVVALKGSDRNAAIYKVKGSNSTTPLLWSDMVSMSGTTCVIASGTSYNGMDLATYGTVVVTPKSDTGAVRYWVDQNTSTNVVSIKSSGSISNVNFNVLCMLGDHASL